MKKLFTITTMLLFAIGAFAQMGEATTPEEYNYMTKGYAAQEQNGLDMKKGYSIGISFNYSDGTRSIVFHELIKGAKDKRGLIAVYNNGSQQVYFCVPNSNPSLSTEIEGKIAKDWQQFAPDAQKFVTMALLYYAAGTIE